MSACSGAGRGGASLRGHGHGDGSRGGARRVLAFLGGLPLPAYFGPLAVVAGGSQRVDHTGNAAGAGRVGVGAPQRQRRMQMRGDVAHFRFRGRRAPRGSGGASGVCAIVPWLRVADMWVGGRDYMAFSAKPPGRVWNVLTR